MMRGLREDVSGEQEALAAEAGEDHGVFHRSAPPAGARRPRERRGRRGTGDAAAAVGAGAAAAFTGSWCS